MQESYSLYQVSNMENHRPKMVQLLFADCCEKLEKIKSYLLD